MTQTQSYAGLLIFTVVLLAITVVRGDEGSDWSKPFQADEHTVVLYHFD